MESAPSHFDKKDTVFCNGEKQLPSTSAEASPRPQRKETNSQHPGVYLTFGNEPKIVCPYCSYVFYKNNPS
jgi:hypothetical protein